MNIKNYDLFLNNIKFIEDYIICDNCRSNKLVNVDPFSYHFLCCNCGETYLFNEDDIKKFKKQYYKKIVRKEN